MQELLEFSLLETVASLGENPTPDKEENRDQNVKEIKHSHLSTRSHVSRELIPCIPMVPLYF
jgi:hypothetical protein